MEASDNVDQPLLSGLASKIRNIDGKPLRSAIRNVCSSRSSGGACFSKGNIVEPFWGSNHILGSSQNSMASSSMPPENQPGVRLLGYFQNKDSKKVKKLRSSKPEKGDGAAVANPLEAKNTWAKYGLKRIQLHEDFFMFQFNSKEGMEKVLVDGPWMIRREPLILNVWSQNTILKKDEIRSVPVWVKLHHVPIVAYSEVGLSLISTQIGKPITLDSYTSNMCANSWGRNTYARLLMMVSAENDLKKRSGGWHTNVAPVESVGNDGFEVVKKRKHKKKKNKQTQNDVDVSVITQDDQAIHTRIWIKAVKKEVFCSFIYAHNHYIQRRSLWRNLGMHKVYIRNRPWCLLGDFNAALMLEDKVMGSSTIDIAMREFKECVEEIEVMDVQRTGMKWSRYFSAISFIRSFPAVLCLPTVVPMKPKPFKFTNILVQNKGFKDVVNEGWNKTVSGFHMYKVVVRLRHMKKAFRKLMYDGGNLHANVIRLRHELDTVQRDLDRDPCNATLREEAAVYLNTYNEAILLEEGFLKQKAKVEWLRDGDSNSAYFHKSVKSRMNRSRIDVISNSDGGYFSDENDPMLIVCFSYEFGKLTIRKLKEALIFEMGKDKRLDPHADGYTALFFIKKRVMHNYHLDRDHLRLLSKVDIQKAYDTVDWGFLKDILLGFGFHMRLIGWIMECVTTTSFSISINGALHGYFKGKRGLSHEILFSPISFTLVMEILTLMIRRRVLNSDSFKFHPYCSKLDLVNLCFADDLFLFSHGDVNSSKVIMEALDEFRDASGLTPSIPKSTAYFCNVLNHVKLSILQIFPFEEGKLPVKYLGVPLVSSRLMFRDCKELIEKVQARVDNWKNKFLSTAGRLQLIQSVIGSLHVFWASVFVLPSQVLLDIEQIMRGFLWCQGKLRNGQAKVAWEEICLPKIEGGLGIRRLACFNNALMVPHIWNLINRKESLWVQWIHSYKLANRNFWDIPIRGNMTCGWRKILRLRPLIRDFIRYKVGDGSSISVWHDCWCDYSPLTNIISNRSIYSAGLHQATTISGSSPDFQSRGHRSGQEDSHEHLFFECSFSKQIWQQVKCYAGLSGSDFSIDNIIQDIIPFAMKRSSKRVAVLTVLAVIIDVAALEELCLAALTGTCPDFVATSVGKKFLLGYG
ncbi:RNA-directed DNA polymerase, eukaryota, reverse transcriptase zinc-binding domain protein [Tanacetum coccineum]|uniref:RNA-directed DNA polymerase, eukaryota, reverse transcriptase zinc-binding domain protein n=1 Tax=Tanacetum coccineum TaxID=301880 RepID=A0ABQ5ISH5_9ASTR